MNEPEIISYGREFIVNYQENEFKDSLRRAFIEHKADFITLDSNPHGQRFLSACTAWAIDKNYLYNDRNASDNQSRISSFRLTEEGRKFLKK
jgi:hypothetical protein